ncbi:MAG: hypothetical protein EOO11_20475, partial [Chitinophagaceae bacterium]
MKPTTAIVLDKRRAKKDGRYPIKLRITFLRDQQYYGTGINLTKEDFDQVEHQGLRRRRR